VRSFRRILLLSLATLLLVPAVARAGAIIGVNDPNDTKGKLDVNRFEGVRTVSGGKVAYKMTFYDPVKTSLLTSPGTFIKVMLDTDNDDIADYTGTMHVGGGSIGISFSGRGEDFEPLRVKRPNPRTFTFVVPAGNELSPNGPLGAKALVVYTSKAGACALACVDEVTDTGAWISL
jgi:hypothetical protein